MLTDECFEQEIRHFDGVRRVYLLPNGYRLSLINSQLLRAHPYAWEAAVLAPGSEFVCFTTPLTKGVEVFHTENAANAFIARAIAWANESTPKG